VSPREPDPSGDEALSRAWLAAVVESSDDVIVSKTLDGVITSWNATAERRLGWTAAEAIGQHITLIIPEDRRAEEEDVLARIRRGERVDHFETVRRTQDGRTYRARARRPVLAAPRGRPGRRPGCRGSTCLAYLARLSGEELRTWVWRIDLFGGLIRQVAPLTGEPLDWIPPDGSGSLRRMLYHVGRGFYSAWLDDGLPIACYAKASRRFQTNLERRLTTTSPLPETACIGYGREDRPFTLDQAILAVLMAEQHLQVTAGSR
jgi:PAS domain S-box-containing protein